MIESKGTIASGIKIMTEHDVCSALGVSRLTLMRERQAGMLKFYRIRGRVMYSEKHIREYLDSMETTIEPEDASAVVSRFRGGSVIKSRGRWCARIRRTDPETGRQVEIKRVARSRKAAVALLDELRRA